ncbi:hypothetical protein JCM8208_006670 [Rhodotorula glutinis]
MCSSAAMQPAAPPALISPPRLPPELILAIIAWCERLETQRESTLAALCRLGHQYKSAAQRGLYSELDLDRAPGSSNIVKDTGLKTLLEKRELRQYVECVKARRVFEQIEHAGVRDLFEDLPSVNTLVGGVNTEILHSILGQSGVRITHLMVDVWNDAAAQLIDGHRDSFDELENLWISEFDQSQCPPSTLKHIKRLTVPATLNSDELADFTASFDLSLRHLDLMISDDLFDEYALEDYPCLSRLSFAFAPSCPFVSNHAAQTVAAGLRSTSTLLSLSLWGSVPTEPTKDVASLTTLDVDFQSLDLESVSYGPSLAPTCAILDALPPSLKHLTIVTDNIPADLLAPYLLAPLRPASLATIRLGGELGRELGGMLRDRGSAPARSWVGALAGELERAEIEVTTMLRARR